MLWALNDFADLTHRFSEMRKRRRQGLGESFEPITLLNKLILSMLTNICAWLFFIFYFEGKKK